MNDTCPTRSGTLILGIGNVLLRDEGVGAAVLKALAPEAEGDPDLCLLDGGTLSFTLATPIATAAALIVVDAAHLDAPPGTLRLFEGKAMDAQLRHCAGSVHEVSLADLMDMARLTDGLPRQRALIGIEPACLDWGEALSPSVAAAVPKAVAIIRGLRGRWRAANP